MQKGRHLLVDCRKVSREVCEDDATMLDVMAMAARRAGATVINTCRYKFGHNSPAGFTAMVMLDESHLSTHCYADEGLMAIDIFTCGQTDPNMILHYIREQVDLGQVSVSERPRFVHSDDDAQSAPQIVELRS